MRPRLDEYDLETIAEALDFYISHLERRDGEGGDELAQTMTLWKLDRLRRLLSEAAPPE